MKALYFGRLGDTMGVEEEILSPPEDVSTTGELRIWLDQRSGTEGALLEPTVRIAVNSEFVSDDYAFELGDEIAFLPPVGGG